MPRLPLGDWVDTGVDWLLAHMSWLFDAIKTVVEGMYDGINAVLTAPQPLLLAGILAVIAWWLRGLVAGVLAFAGFLLIDSLDLWDRAMSTLALVLVATVIALVISIPLGIWAARSKAVSAVVRPALDLLQTMPSMVLLIPAILFFGLGTSAGVIATLIFALAPGVRMTELGIRQVDAELVEAAEAFGTSPRDTLLRVQLPLALPDDHGGRQPGHHAGSVDGRHRRHGRHRRPRRRRERGHRPARHRLRLRGGRGHRRPRHLPRPHDQRARHPDLPRSAAGPPPRPARPTAPSRGTTARAPRSR